SEWLPALAGGVRTAGFPNVADRLWRTAGTPGGIETRMAFYGELFLVPGQQGDEPPPLTPEQAQLAEVLAVEWLRRAATRATKEKARRTGTSELTYVAQQMGAEQGVGSAVRSATSSLVKLSWFAPFGMALAERFVNRALGQVTQYFTNDKVRSATLAS